MPSDDELKAQSRRQFLGRLCLSGCWPFLNPVSNVVRSSNSINPSPAKLAKYFMNVHNMMLGDSAMSKVVDEVRNSQLDSRNLIVRGRDMLSGLQRKTVISFVQIRDALGGAVLNGAA